MHIREIYDKKDKTKLIAYSLYKSMKDPKTKKYTNKERTYRIPEHITTKKEQKAFLNKCMVEWEEIVENMKRGIINPLKDKIRFIDYAKQWVEDILINNKESYNHYSRNLDQLKVLEEQFGNYTLEDMTQPVIKEFMTWLQTRTYTKEKVIVVNSLRDLIKERCLTLVKVAKECGISDTTLKVALSIGESIYNETAKRLCDYLNVPYYKYFKLEQTTQYYSKSSNQGLKIMLHGILQSAVRDGLIPVNYSSSGYQTPLKGKTGTKEIYKTMEEITEFINKVEEEKDIRKKVAFSLLIKLGLRTCEVAGLEWKDFDFENNEVSIVRNCLYISMFGIITKDTKSENSKRTISIPSSLVELLKEYKTYWLVEKKNHGNLWAKTDRLFVQNGGNDMSNMTISSWLKEFQIKNNLKRVTSHGLRHTNITMLISNNVDIKTVSARAGHSDIQTTLNIYTHYFKQADKEASNKIDELFKRKSAS